VCEALSIGCNDTEEQRRDIAVPFGSKEEKQEEDFKAFLCSFTGMGQNARGFWRENPGGGALASENPGSRAPLHRAAPPLSASRTRGSKQPYVIRARLRLSPPISSDRWTCSPSLVTRSMSRFPAVAGRAPRRQEEGERSRELQEERPAAVSIVDRGAVRGTLGQPAGVGKGDLGGGVKVRR
jgi:hypothetical protein